MIGVNLSPVTELMCIDARPDHVPVPLVTRRVIHVQGLHGWSYRILCSTFSRSESTPNISSFIRN